VRRWRLIAGACAFVLAACAPKIAKPNPPKFGARQSVVANAQPGAADAGESPPPKVDFKESDFQESDQSRDPFRSYAEMFVEQAKTKVKNQRKVVLDQYSIDELKLIGIVTRVHPSVAMLVGPDGKGYVVKRGEFVGRPEQVQAGQGGASYEINWRVDRIRPNDVVLVRENPANPDVPTATKVLPLIIPEPGENGQQAAN
jgi:type IV pilus assembly protein PilP